MPGGLFILQAYGDADVKFSGNPQTTFFSKTYRRYTHFSQEPIFSPLDGPQQLSFQDTILLKHTIKRKADLLKSMFLTIQLPDIYSKLELNGEDVTGYAFRWIPNLANIIIDQAEIFIGGNKVDSFNGLYSYLHKKLDYEEDEQFIYDSIAGNTPEFTNPGEGPLGNSSAEYPYVVRDLSNSNAILNPSIRGKQLFIPLPFWFCNDPGQSIPLIALQGHEVEIHLRLRPIIHLYQVKQYGTDTWVRPEPGTATALRHFLSPFFGDTGTSDTWNLTPQILSHYIYLSNDERKDIALRNNEYLIVQRNHFFLRTPVSYRYRIEQHNLVRRILVTARRSDLVETRNEFTNLTNWEDPTQAPKTALTNAEISGVNATGIETTNYSRDILQEMSIYVNGNTIFDTQTAPYYNGVQAYIGNKTKNIPGIYQYNFSLFPREYQPSGSLNASRVKSLELDLQLESIPFTSVTDASGVTVSTYDYEYIVDIFTENYNFLTITSGLGGLMYAR
jgi:hypothetical protein